MPQVKFYHNVYLPWTIFVFFFCPADFFRWFGGRVAFRALGYRCALGTVPAITFALSTISVTRYIRTCALVDVPLMPCDLHIVCGGGCDLRGGLQIALYVANFATQ